jgi:hypothetical protein
MAAAPELDEALGVRLAYSPHKPEPPQHAYLWLNRLEALSGGAAGGGKSDALLMAALQYVDVPGYAAILFRRTFTDLALPGGLIPRSLEWLAGTDAKWNEVRNRWTFPSGATLSFGYLQTSNHRYRYGSSEFQFVGFDELTEFPEDDYTFLFSRLRKPGYKCLRCGEQAPTDRAPCPKCGGTTFKDPGPLARVPLRMRGATNPGGRGHAWVKRRFITKRPRPDDPEDTPAKCRRRVFIPARLADNPHIDHASYVEALGNLTREDRARLLGGDWDVDLGDRYYDQSGVDAALAIGQELDYLLEHGGTELDTGERVDLAPPPVGDLLVAGVDWGDHAFYLIGWPLEAGGLYVVAGGPLRALEPGAATNRILAELAEVPAWPGRPRVRDPLELVDEVRYDAAGLQSQRTFNAIARRRRPGLKARAIPFGNYKRETGGYLRLLLERAGEGHRTRILAVSGRVDPLFIEQLRNLRRDPADEELPLKPDRSTDEEERDDGPDALIALTAPIAVRNRARGAPRRRR